MNIISDPNFTNASETLTNDSGLIARYLLEEHSSGDIDNSSSVHHDGTLGGSGVPTVVGGVIGNALSLSGSHYWTLGSDNADELIDFTGGNEWAVSFWVKISSSTSTDAEIISNPRLTGGFRSFRTYLTQSNGKLNVKASNSGGSSTTIQSTSNLLPLLAEDEAWVHIAIVADTTGSSGNLRLYINGSQEDSGTLKSTRDGDSNEVWLGAFYKSSGLGYQDSLAGGLDDVRFYGTKLTGSQVTNIYNVGGEGSSSSGSVSTDKGWRFTSGGIYACPANVASSESVEFDLDSSISSGEAFDITITVPSNGIYGGSSAECTIVINGVAQGGSRSLSVGDNSFSFVSDQSSSTIGLEIDGDTNGFFVSALTLEEADITPPVITLSGASSVSIDQGDTYVDAGATATDDVDGDLTPSISVTNSVNTSVAGTYSVTYNVSDSTGNAATPVVRTVNVIPPDTDPPVITLNGSSSVSINQGDSYVDAGATATDAVDGNLTSSIVQSGGVNTSVAGTYNVYFDVSDSSGNAAVQAVRTVTVSAVADTVAPTITLNGSSEISIFKYESFTDPGATAEDSEEGDVTSSIVTSGTVDSNTIGTYYIYYNVSDSSGNSAEQVVRTVNVVRDTYSAFVDGKYFEYFSVPCTGGSMEYELNVYPGVPDTSTDFSFGFCSGESIVFSFSGSCGKIYDNDGNFVYSYQGGINNPFEIFGNAFEDYQNYSINRVPVNLNCSKTFGNYIDGFYYDNDNFRFGLIVKSPQDNASEIASY